MTFPFVRFCWRRSFLTIRWFLRSKNNSAVDKNMSYSVYSETLEPIIYDFGICFFFVQQVECEACSFRSYKWIEYIETAEEHHQLLCFKHRPLQRHSDCFIYLNEAMKHFQSTRNTVGELSMNIPMRLRFTSFDLQKLDRKILVLRSKQTRYL